MPLHSAAQWGKNFDKVVYERPVLHSMNKLAETEDPRSVQGTDVGLSACLACYCLGLSIEEESEQKPGDWLSVSRQHCDAYIAGWVRASPCYCIANESRVEEVSEQKPGDWLVVLQQHPYA
eukprot:1154090-Pelagomonas_calceolata.AAC.7